MTVPGEAAAFHRQLGESTLRIFHGDLATVRADVLVASDDDRLIVDGGLAASLQRVGGPAVYEEARVVPRRELGTVIPTTAGELPARQVFHAIVVDRTRQKPTTAELIQRAVEQCLKLCDERGFTSIAFPALATGAGQFSAEASAMAIVVQIYRYLSGTTGIKSVMIVLYAGGGYESETAQRFYTQVRQYLDVMSSIDMIANTRDVGKARVKASAVKAALERDAVLSDPGVAGERWATQDAFRQLDELSADLETESYRSASRDVLSCVSELEQARRDLRRRPLVISLHGIRTRGVWQKEITLPINRAGFDHLPLDYGRFGLIRFILPWTRQGRIPWFRDRYDEIRKQADDIPSVIAHSLGSYIVANAIAKFDCKFREVIFCGAIVQTDYDWPTVIKKGRVRRVLNDHGGLDIWPRFAHNILHDAGVSGVEGFSKVVDGRVINRSHEAFRHSDYFYEGNYRDAWIPFLLGRAPEEPTNSERPARSRPFWRNVVIVILLLVVARLVWMLW
jgi:O-acetyl-ADP-ribose deacetylase (regulator of RNase III)